MVALSPFLCTRLLTGCRQSLRLTKTTTCFTMHNTNRRHIHVTNTHRDADAQQVPVEEVVEPLERPLPVVPRRFNLTFEEYIKLKRSLRTKQRISGGLFGFTSGFGFASALPIFYPQWFIPAATPEEVPLVFGMDPMIVSAGGTAVVMLCGYSVGCGVLKVLWSAVNRRECENLNARDSDFLQRLDKHRFTGESDFEDDFYGESIKNLSDYRQWVRQHEKKKAAAAEQVINLKTT